VSAPQSTVLYDALGNRGRRRVRLLTMAFTIGLLVLAYAIVGRLADQGQLRWERWSPLLDPTDEDFQVLWRFLLGGLGNTLLAAAAAIGLSLVLGTLLGTLRVTSAPWYRWAVVGIIELLRGVPVVIAIFFASRVLPEASQGWVERGWIRQPLDLPLLWYVVIGLVVYNSVVIAEIIRAGVAAVPRGQTEAALAIGLTRGQAMRTVLLPQAFRIMLPALISQLVVALKDTSLGFIIGFQELLRRANLSIQTTRSPIQTLLIIAAIYIAINYSLGRLAEHVHARTARARGGREAGGETLELEPAGPVVRRETAKEPEGRL
jgi:glutamate transport system permease protein